MKQPVIATFANVKGGSGKTTCIGFTAHALVELGYRVLVVDADPLEMFRRWREKAPQPLPFDMAEFPSTEIHRQLPGMIGNRYDVVLIDTPGNVVQKAITASAVRAATQVIVPITASGLEEWLLDDVIEMINGAESRHGSLMLLLSRTVYGTNSLAVYREHYKQYGIDVFPQEISNLQQFVIHGSNLRPVIAKTVFGDLARYIMKKGEN